MGTGDASVSELSIVDLRISVDELPDRRPGKRVMTKQTSSCMFLHMSLIGLDAEPRKGRLT